MSGGAYQDAIMPKAQPPTLVGGPYKAPRCRLGRVLCDRLRGKRIQSSSLSDTETCIEASPQND
jgi:hypothetical protein